MTQEFWLLFVAASIPIHLAPGPNNILALTHGAQFGYARGHLGSLGRFPAYLTFFLVSGVGLGAALAASATFFILLKWVGAAYLVWIGIQVMRSAAPTVSADGSAEVRLPLTALWKREFLASATNPKAILFASAFYAQFIDPSSPNYALQFSQMVMVSILLEILAAGTYAAAGGRVGAIAKKYDLLGWVMKLSGSALIVAGMLLAVSRRPQTAP